jgi:hypothetical protein
VFLIHDILRTRDHFAPFPREERRKGTIDRKEHKERQVLAAEVYSTGLGGSRHLPGASARHRDAQRALQLSGSGIDPLYRAREALTLARSASEGR